MNLPICLLVDNGSLRPEAVLTMRRVAHKLSIASSFDVRPVRLLHSDKIVRSKLHNQSGVTIVTFLPVNRVEMTKNFWFCPFFWDPVVELPSG